MTLTLKQSNAIAALAEALYDFLPGSGNKQWKGHVSFKTVAEKVGVGDFWQPGSKTPMIAGLLEKTLQSRAGKFEPLVLEIVKCGLLYRNKQGRPVASDEIDKINGLLVEVGFKFPALWDTGFKASLAIGSANVAKQHVEAELQKEKTKEQAQTKRAAALQAIRDSFFNLAGMADRKRAGLLLERVLNELFRLSGLNPRKPFCVVGEQIDGSFDLNHETYLVEAKWEAKPLAEEPLLTFRGKIEGKSAYTRGLFISVNGYSVQAKQAIVTGKQPTFFALDGYDLTMLLSGDRDLAEYLRARRRLLAEEGLVFVPYSDVSHPSHELG